MKDKIVNLLGQGFSVGVVAGAVGCDPSYISQVAAELAPQIDELRLKNLSQAATLDSKVVDLEEKLLNRVEALIPFITRPVEAAKCYQIMNNAKRHATPSLATSDTKSPIVNLTVPVHLAVQLQISPDRQVVEVAGRSMATLPAAQLVHKLAERTELAKAQARLAAVAVPVKRQTVAHLL